jgi:hypothetical protein
MQRGNQRPETFFSDSDYREYLSLVAVYKIGEKGSDVNLDVHLTKSRLKTIDEKNLSFILYNDLWLDWLVAGRSFWFVDSLPGKFCRKSIWGLRGLSH